MTIVVLGSVLGVVFGWLMGFLSLFLILLILVQRGKGGGLTGALGGPGGQSAFGSKAGDTFTVITIVVASLWGLTCALAMLTLGTDRVTPTAASETNVSAGPGDEDETVGTPAVPGLGSGLTVSPGELGSGDLSSGDDAPTTGSDSNVELTPSGTTDQADDGGLDSADTDSESAADDSSAESGSDESTSDESASDESAADDSSDDN